MLTSSTFKVKWVIGLCAIVAAWSFTTPAAIAQPTTDSLINLIQWQEADGGNGHWYAVLPGKRYWDDAHAIAATLEQEGQPGYLATVTTPEENQFLLDHVVAGTNQPASGDSVLDQFWFDGRYVGGHWTWVTGEPFSYTNWSSGEPNNTGIETALGMWGPNQENPLRIPGKWNNALPNDSINPYSVFWSIVEWGDLDTSSHVEPDTLINLVQWPSSEGGNDHWYAVLPGKRYWDDAYALAPTFEHEGRPGYLATVTTPEENQFILNYVIAGTHQPTSGNAVLDQFWLDGRDVGGHWAWMTGEHFSYSNWSTGEPNNVGIETALGMWGPNQDDYRRIPGKWNNALPNDSVNPYSVFWSLIEWGDFDTTTYVPPDTLINIVQWPSSAGGNDHWYAVLARELYWFEAAALASSFQRNGEGGYLATVTSAAENQFILQHVLGDTYQPSILDLFWLDGREISGSWRWLTNEPFVYTNWASGEPNNPGVETALSMAGPNVTNPLSPPGTWINALPDNQVNTLHRWWSVVEWGVPDSTVPPDTTLPPDTIVNLIKWPASEGGNDHWYAVMTGEHYWVDAQRMAADLELDGKMGYLATITTPAENDFILNHVIVGTNQPSVLDMFWLGGRDFGSWQWITGEPLVYVNWSTGEPNNQGIETALGMWGYHQSDPRRIPGKWNNSLPDPTINPLARFWSLVEWGDFDSTIAPPVCGNGILEIGEACDDGNLIAGDGCDPWCQNESTSDIEVYFTTDQANDTLYAGMPGSIVFYVNAPVDQEIAAMAFPLIYQFTNGNIIGPIAETGEDAVVHFSAKAQSVFESRTWNTNHGLAATDPDTTVTGCVDFGGSVWSGSGEVWRIDFVPRDTGTIVIDESAVPPLTGLELVDPDARVLDFAWQSKSIVVLPSMPTGDLDGSAAITSADVVYLVNYVFKGGPAPSPCEAAADVNCSGDINAADIIKLIGYIFKSASAPCNAGALTEAGLWLCP